MATGNFEFYSHALCRMANFRILLPNDLPPEMTAGNPCFARPMKTLCLLHGYSGSSSDWLLNSLISDIAARYNLAAILPCGENSFYLDGEATGRQYCTYVGEELIQYARQVFGLSARREDTLIAGISMGGFGALHTALAYPQTFAKTICLSGALITHNVEKMQPGDTDSVANYAYYRLMFGEPSALAHSRSNPEYLVDQLLQDGEALPGIFMAVGTEDFLYGENQIFRRFLESRRVPFTYRESAGAHDYRFWNPYIEPAVRWALEENDADRL